MMTRTPTWLLMYQDNIYSQAGEDGVILKILEMLPKRDNWCVEFGAWDGQHLSNTRYLIETQGYTGVLIEGDPDKFRVLQHNYTNNDRVIPLNKFVGFSTNDNLDCLLEGTPVPYDFDLLSIDIDGNDYHVWKAISAYCPKVVCIEYNTTIPTEVDFIQPADPSYAWGASLLALTKLGKLKGYELVCVLPWNALFVRAEYFPLFEIEDNHPLTLRTSNEYVTHIFSGFDGTILMSGYRRLPWHNIPLEQTHYQVLPKPLRHYPDNYRLTARILLPVYRLLYRLRYNPIEIVHKAVNRLRSMFQ